MSKKFPSVAKSAVGIAVPTPSSSCREFRVTAHPLGRNTCAIDSVPFKRVARSSESSSCQKVEVTSVSAFARLLLFTPLGKTSPLFLFFCY